MRHRAAVIGLGLLVSMGLAGCGAPSPVAPAPATAPSTEEALSQEVELTGEASTSDTYEVQQYYRDMGGGMVGPTRGVTPTNRDPMMRRPVYMGGIPISGPLVGRRPTWQELQDFRMRARVRAAAEAVVRASRRAAETYRMARWQAMAERYAAGRQELQRLRYALDRAPNPAFRAHLQNRIMLLEQRLTQYRLELQFGGR